MAGLGRSTRCLQEAAVGGVVLPPRLSQGSDRCGMGCVLLLASFSACIWLILIPSCSLLIRCPVNGSERLFRSASRQEVPPCRSARVASLSACCHCVLMFKILGSVAQWLECLLETHRIGRLVEFNEPVVLLFATILCAILSSALRTLQFEGLLKRLHHERVSLSAVGKSQVMSPKSSFRVDFHDSNWPILLASI